MTSKVVVYIEKLAGRDWKKEELGESSNYYIIALKD
jgi:hypothetical protein